MIIKSHLAFSLEAVQLLLLPSNPQYEFYNHIQRCVCNLSHNHHKLLNSHNYAGVSNSKEINFSFIRLLAL